MSQSRRLAKSAVKLPSPRDDSTSTGFDFHFPDMLADEPYFSSEIKSHTDIYSSCSPTARKPIVDERLDVALPTPDHGLVERDSALTQSEDKSSEHSHVSVPGECSVHEPPYHFKSYKLRGKYEQPWLADKKLRKKKFGNVIIGAFIIGALMLSAYINYKSYQKISKHDYCLVLDESFAQLNPDVWNHEVQINGYGNGAFDWTTADSGNSYVDTDGLHIVPTLTTESTPITRDQILDNYVLNLTREGGDGTCTGTQYFECSIQSNASDGAIIPPIRSARLNTRGKKSIKYGRIEVEAKLPVGDWIWPAIWMMPEDPQYGPWPASGEIDIMESRGNNVEYEMGGRDILVSTLHWGPTPSSDLYWKTNNGRRLRRTDFTKAFHVFGIEWSKDYLFTYIDSKLQQVLYMNFEDKRSMWERGGFSQKMENSSLLKDPWTQTGNRNTPFDQDFYLILNVAVGAKNGWFLDGRGGKPWVDTSETAASDFYKAIDKWLPTWGKGKDAGMTVKSVKMWQEGRCKS